MLKDNNRHSRKRLHYNNISRSVAFIVNFEHISDIFLLFLLLILSLLGANNSDQFQHVTP